MSDNTTWQIESTILGGVQRTAEASQIATVARALEECADGMTSAASGWASASLAMQWHRSGTFMCPTMAGVPYAPGHASFPYQALDESTARTAAQAQELGGKLARMASLLRRAHSIYDDAESSARRSMNESLQMMTGIMPEYAGLGGLTFAFGSFVVGSIREGNINPIHAIDGLSWAHEGLMSGLGMLVGGINPIDGLRRTDEVNVAAGRLATLSAPIKGLVQGDILTVTEVRSNTEVVRASSSVADSLENLRRLGEERLGKIELNSGLDYATIAIQRYRKEDGSSAWLVTIPGTDGKFDSPFGWAQNIELMSANPSQRMRADSARMVLEAMEQAGIPSDEPVVLVGHSQGGIVAAAIASDMSNQYDIQHVVTAGSPVANHPIPAKTWVTSIEIEDELVAALDGAPNPTTENWLTIHGKATSIPGTGPTSESSASADGQCMPSGTPSDRSRDFSGAAVRDAPQRKEITHWLKYHQAAYQNATDLGSPAVDTHAHHFEEIIDGELEQTRYFQGRMSHLPTSTKATAPAQRHAMRTFGG